MTKITYLKSNNWMLLETIKTALRRF